MDWIAGMREQREIAERMVEEVPQALAATNLTADQALRLYQIVVERSEEFEQFFVEMQDDNDAGEVLMEAGDRLADVWTSLSLACANKVRTTKGLPPIEVTDDE